MSDVRACADPHTQQLPSPLPPHPHPFCSRGVLHYSSSKNPRGGWSEERPGEPSRRSEAELPMAPVGVE
eukprot:15346634-Alexandrium_andersonii.AAC.1